MIVERIIDVVFTLLRLLMGYLPYDDQLLIADRIVDIYGYSVYMLGSSFYNRFLGALIGIVMLKVSWRLILFIVNLVRGSGA